MSNEPEPEHCGRSGVVPCACVSRQHSPSVDSPVAIPLAIPIPIPIGIGIDDEERLRIRGVFPRDVAGVRRGRQQARGGDRTKGDEARLR